MRTTVLALALLAGPLPAAAQAHDHAHHRDHGGTEAAVEHPEPRPGITAVRVLARFFLRSGAGEAYAAAREVPAVLDGLFCYCECHERDGKRSLLECFEDDMAASCGVCQNQAKLARRLHREGKSLHEIRAAVDARYGD